MIARLDSALRITPAYAGKRYFYIYVWFLSWDHPRLRGEKVDFVSNLIDFVGSPPLTRGKVKRNLINEDKRRITPAYAGKRAVYAAAQAVFWDHPRLRGEKEESALK